MKHLIIICVVLIGIGCEAPKQEELKVNEIKSSNGKVYTIEVIDGCE